MPGIWVLSYLSHYSDTLTELAVYTRPQLFKTNDILSSLIAKTLIIKDGIYANIFAEKNVSSFCICKSYSHFFSKNTYELDIVLNRAVNILTINGLVKLTML